MSTTIPLDAFAEGYAGGGSTGTDGTGGSNNNDRRTWVYFEFKTDSSGNPLKTSVQVAGVTIDKCANLGGSYFAFLSSYAGGIRNQAYPTMYWPKLSNTYQNNCGGNGDNSNNLTPICDQNKVPDSSYYDSDALKAKAIGPGLVQRPAGGYTYDRTALQNFQADLAN